jgi:hypothetical protein
LQAPLLASPAGRTLAPEWPSSALSQFGQKLAWRRYFYSKCRHRFAGWYGSWAKRPGWFSLSIFFHSRADTAASSAVSCFFSATAAQAANTARALMALTA